MKHLNLIFIIALIGGTSAWAQTQSQKHLNQLIAAENGFVKLAADSGVKKAFLLSLDEKSINFDNNKPVDGLTLWKASAENKKAALIWHPANAAVSAFGDMGFTMGPAVYKPNIDSARGFNSYFFSVWKRNAAGKFKVVLDGGCRRPADAVMEAKLTDGKPLAKRPVSKPAKSLITVDQLENSFITACNADAKAAYHKHMADSAWALRPGKIAGKNKTDNLTMVINPKITECKYTFVSGETAQSNDLAYAYGTVTLNIINKAGVKQAANGFYVRTWQKLNGEWKIVGDMLSY
ncbi:DUF4440 domain-containing protein [Mucilaginibacter terrae]|uniref:Ketosteroid isomerase-like protein n=1 Tax=Mucilaginibacter terrae TaxID=1955052 RepID=A0ABU3GZK6_9SPHI|nr:DUF4440 domain-containing protein [Mucilaginibacter terrae]MDT3405193.1 ketosteroid isomerase-like protein [Mucilaginibacter terrae]